MPSYIDVDYWLKDVISKKDVVLYIKPKKP